MCSTRLLLKNRGPALPLPALPLSTVGQATPLQSTDFCRVCTVSTVPEEGIQNISRPQTSTSLRFSGTTASIACCGSRTVSLPEAGCFSFPSAEKQRDAAICSHLRTLKGSNSVVTLLFFKTNCFYNGTCVCTKSQALFQEFSICQANISILMEGKTCL